MLDTFFSPLNSVQVSLNFTVSFFSLNSVQVSHSFGLGPLTQHIWLYFRWTVTCGGHRSR